MNRAQDKTDLLARFSIPGLFIVNLLAFLLEYPDADLALKLTVLPIISLIGAMIQVAILIVFYYFIVGEKYE